MPQLRFDLKDLFKVSDGLKRLGGETEVFMRRIAQTLTASAKERFVDETDPEGNKWKKGVKNGGQTLTLSGLLRRSITNTSDDKTAAFADKVLNEVKTLLEKEILPIGALEKIKGSIDTMSGGIMSLINAPDVWALEIMDLLDIDGASFDLYERLAALSLKPSKPQYLTETRKRSVKNQENVLTLFKTVAVLQGLNKGVLMETSSDLQTAERIERMTALAESVTDADAEIQQAFETALQTSVAVLKSVKKERTKQITAAETIPAVVLLHQTGGTALMRKNEDFVPRNHIRHPLFVAGGLITEIIDV